MEIYTPEVILMKIIYTTFSNEKDAKEITKKLVEEKLIACGNIFPIKSFYYWENSLQEDEEYAAVLKTKDSVVDEAVERLKELHPYTAPAIIVFSAELKSENYAKWMDEVVKTD